MKLLLLIYNEHKYRKYMLEEKLYSKKTLSEFEYEKALAKTSIIKISVTNRLVIKREKVIEIAEKDWDSIKEILKNELEKHGIRRGDLFADALIEEAKTRARDLLKKHLETEDPSLVEKIAKLIIAIAISEEPAEQATAYIGYTS